MRADRVAIFLVESIHIIYSCIITTSRSDFCGVAAPETEEGTVNISDSQENQNKTSGGKIPDRRDYISYNPRSDRANSEMTNLHRSGKVSGVRVTHSLLPGGCLIRALVGATIDCR